MNSSFSIYQFIYLLLHFKQFQTYRKGAKAIQRIPASPSPRFSSCLHFTTFVPSPFLSYTYRLFQTWYPITAKYSIVHLPKVRTCSCITTLQPSQSGILVWHQHHVMNSYPHSHIASCLNIVSFSFLVQNSIQEHMLHLVVIL